MVSILFIVLILLGVYIFIKYNFCDPIYCMDEYNEARMLLEKRIEKLSDSYAYWKEQSIETDRLFKESLSQSKEQQAEILQAKKECEANLNSDSIMLKNLKAKLASNDYNFSTSSVLGKRSRLG